MDGMSVVKSDLFEKRQLIKRPSGTHDHAGEGAFSNNNRQPRLLAQQYVEILEQGASAGQNYAPVDYVSSEFGGRSLQGGFNAFHDAVDRAGDGSPYFLGINLKGFGNAGYQVSSLHVNAPDLFFRVG